jgi:hypothetical protein
MYIFKQKKTAGKFISKDEVFMQETARCLDVCLAELGWSLA